jgi:type I restriction enzyme S subunit
MINEIPLPTGWVWTTVENIVTKEKIAIKRGPFGSSVKKAYFVEHGYKVYEQQNVINQDFTLGDYYIDEERYGILKDFAIAPGDLLITGAGTIGKLAIVPENIQPGIINQALLKLSIDRSLVNIYFFVLAT